MRRRNPHPKPEKQLPVEAVQPYMYRSPRAQTLYSSTGSFCKSAAHQEENREWNVSKQEWYLC